LFLNNDVLVSDGWLTNLVRGLEQDPKIGLIGPMTNSISGRQSFTEVSYKDEDGFYEFAQSVRTANRGKITPRRRIAGFAMLMKKSVFDEVGGFDESFGTGNFEDDDLCLRVRDLGYAIMVDESTFIHHYGSQTFKANHIDYKQNIKERMQLFRKKWPDVDYSELLEINRSLQQDHCDELKTADKYIEQEDIDKAAPIYQKVFRENPLSHDAMYGLSLIDYVRKDYSESLVRLKQLLVRNPSYVKAYNLLGMICYATQKYEQAETFFKKTIELDSGNVDAHQNLAEALLSQRKFSEAETRLRRNLERFPEQINSYIRMAQLFAGRGLSEKAVPILERALELEPHNNSVKEMLSALRQNVGAQVT
ncbi:MAG: tetratricopeptide repeat protein, partial [Candidatus Marinimicrobia bacterium]|nr:tetratricopeptide repeat protein [Candidatus Neomarinimicrobiota bacterium]